MIALLGKGGEELKAFFEKIWKAIADWFLKNKKVFVDWTKKIQKAFGSDSKSDGLFRDIFKKFVVNNKGALTQRQFLKIAKQIEKHFGTKLYWIDRNSQEFVALFKKWQDNPIFAVFHSTTFKNGRYGIMLEGPAIYFFNGISKLGHKIEITAYTLQHELIHLKLWYKMTKEFPELASLYRSIPRWLDEANVIGEMLAQNAQKVGKWSMDDIMNDLHTLNNNLRDIPQWQRSFKSLTGKERMELSDFDNWDLSKFLDKL